MVSPMPTEFEFKSFFVDLFSFQMYSENGASVEKQKRDTKAKQEKMKQDLTLHHYGNMHISVHYKVEITFVIQF